MNFLFKFKDEIVEKEFIEESKEERNIILRASFFVITSILIVFIVDLNNNGMKYAPQIIEPIMYVLGFLPIFMMIIVLFCLNQIKEKIILPLITLIYADYYIFNLLIYVVYPQPRFYSLEEEQVMGVIGQTAILVFYGLSVKSIRIWLPFTLFFWIAYFCFGSHSQIYSFNQILSFQFFYITPIVFLYCIQRFEKNKFLHLRSQQQQTQRYQEFYNNYLQIPIIFMVMDKSKYNCCQFFNINQSFSSKFHISKDQQSSDYEVKRVLKDFVLFKNQNRMNMDLEEIFKSKMTKSNEQLLQAEFVVTTMQNSYFQMTMKRIEWDEQNTLVITFNEITNEINLNTYKEINKYQDNLLASVSHELQTPLNSLLFYLKKSYSLCRDDEQRSLLQKSQQTSNMLLFLISDILDFSQIKNKQLRINPVSFSILDLKKQIFDLFQFQVQRKGIKLIFQETLSRQIIFNDENRLQQVLVNFISNALKFTLKGYVKISITDYFESEKISSAFQISIEDTGCGMEKNIIDNLFQPYNTFDNSLSVNINGVGLGLIISKSLIGLMGPDETVTVKSELAKGTIFSFKIYQNFGSSDSKVTIILILSKLIQLYKEQDYSLPMEEDAHVQLHYGIILRNKSLKSIKLKGRNEEKKEFNEIKCQTTTVFESKVDQDDEEEQEEDSSVEKILIQYYKGKKLQVLIVDDNSFNVDAFEDYLSAFESYLLVQTAFSGFQTIEILKADSNYDIIFLDIDMPQMDGMETVQEIKKLPNLNNPNLEICFVSGNDSICYDDDQFRQLFYISQPITDEEMIQFFQYFSSKHR